MKDNDGLLIASIVAIVAIVGLVILFSGQSTGAYGSDICGEGFQYELVQVAQGQHGKICVPKYAVAPKEFRIAAGDRGRASDASPEYERSLIQWCKTFPDVCCQKWPNECAAFLAK